MKDKNKSWYHILMADGNIGDHDTIKKAARECGVNHIFTSVYNGSQLMEFLTQRSPYQSPENGKPDLLIMDIHLDNVDGFKILSWISEQKKNEFPIYVLTKSRNESEVARAMTYGIKDYFQKPLTFDEWKEIVGSICKASFSRDIESKRAEN